MSIFGKLSLKDRWVILLSGMGYYKLSARRRKILLGAFLASVAIHILGLLIFWGAAIMWAEPKKEVAIFRPPPPVRKYEPRKLELQVKVKKRQKSSSRPAVLPRITAAKVKDIALPEIKVDPKLITTSFQPKFKAVSGKGVGVGLGDGYGESGFGDGVSAINFFGIRARGERVMIAVDVSVSMVEEAVGGFEGFQAVKERLNQVVDSLRPMSMFNLVVFADAASIMEPKGMIVANNENKTRAKMYLRPFNVSIENCGHDNGNYQGSSHGLRAYGGTTRMDLAISAAYEHGADTLLIISDGLPRVRKGYTPQQIQAHRQMQQQWMQQHAAEIAAWDRAYAAAEANVVVSTEKVWVPEQPAIPPRPPSKKVLKEGEPIDKGHPGRPAIPGHWAVRTVRHGGWTGPPRPRPPELPDPGFWTLADFVEHMNLLHKALYESAGKKHPVVHCIGYKIDKEGATFLSALAKHFHGQYRTVTTLRK